MKVKIWGPDWMSERDLTAGEWTQLSELLQLGPVPAHNVISDVEVTVHLEIV